MAQEISKQAGMAFYRREAEDLKNQTINFHYRIQGRKLRLSASSLKYFACAVIPYKIANKLHAYQRPPTPKRTKMNQAHTTAKHFGAFIENAIFASPYF